MAMLRLPIVKNDISSMMQDTSRDHLSAEHLKEVQQLVHTQPWVFKLPSHLGRAFQEHRQVEFSRHSIVRAPLLLFLYVICRMLGYLLFSFEIDGVDRERWWLCSSVTAVISIFGLVLVQFRILERRFWWVCMNGTIALASSLYLTMTLSSPELVRYESYVVMFVITVVMLALRLTIVMAVLSCVLAGIVAYAIARYEGASPDIRHMTFYFMAAVLLNGFVAWLLERQERLNFVQSLLLHHEMSERELLNAKLDKMARQDLLSKLANRRHFDEVLADEWERSKREKHYLGLLFIDVDHFKAYNDHYGHLAGDLCISRVGEVLKGALLRPADMAARYGGEEFVVLLPNTEIEGARKVAKRILSAIDALAIPHQSSPTAANLTVSIGITALRPDQWAGPKTLLDTADKALYEAKSSGRHQVHEAQAHGLPV